MVGTQEAANSSGIWRATIGLQACHNGAVTCFTTRRAPSSPHLACGLNGSFFLRICGPPSAAQAGRLLGVLEGAEPCVTLRGWMFYATLMNARERLKSEGASGKRLVFF